MRSAPSNGRGNNGYLIYWAYCGTDDPLAGIDQIVRQPWGRFMTIIYWIGGILSIVLFVYLLIALLKPEAFE